MDRVSGAKRSDAAWERLRDAFATYELVRPGDPSFVCDARACTADCCHALTVPLDDADVDRLARVSGLAPSAFVESEAGVPIALPLAQPYVLARHEGHCVFLDADLACSRYEGRPGACRDYPFQLLVLDGDTLRPRREGKGEGSGEGADRVVLLLRHARCPGFTGPPLSDEGWRSVVGELGSPARPGP